MIERHNGAHWRVHFESLAEMVQWTRSTPRKWSENTSRTNTRDNSWDLGAGYEGALELAERGWEAGIRNLAALALTVPNNTITVREMSVAGDFPDVPRYLAGDPFNMVRRGKQRVPKPALTICVNTVASAIVTGRELANFGAAIVALVDRLESRGVRVELIGAICANENRGKVSIAWHIKRAEDHLDLAAVAFSLAHPACFRRIGFAAIERSPRELEQPGYGRPADASPEHLLDAPEDVLCIQGVQGSAGACRTMDGALAFAKAQINRAYADAGMGDSVIELEEIDD